MKGTLVQISVLSDCGIVRPDNEDRPLAIPPWREPAVSAGACLFGVADGMGGHTAGEVASDLATRALCKWLASHRYRRDDDYGTLAIEDAFTEANSAVFEYARAHPDLQGMGTTLTAGLIVKSRMILGHVGDSRAYLLRKGKLQQLTKDHTLVAEQVRSGLLDADAAAKHPGRHILSRALGAREFVTVDTNQVDLEVGDIVLFCSDGIYNLISDSVFQDEIYKKPFRGLAERLIKQACNAGGPDNATVVAVLLEELPVAFPGRYSWSRLKAILSEWALAKA